MNTLAKLVASARADAEHPAVRAVRGGRAVVAQLSELPPVEADAWRRRINRDAHACGCGSAAASILAGLLALLGAGVAWASAFVRAPVKSGLLAIAFLAVCALTGKAIGLMVARARLARTLRSLALTLQRRASTHLTQ